MVEQENTQRVKDFYAAVGRGDMPAVLAALADDIEWVIPGPPDVPWTGAYTGKHALLAWFGRMAEHQEFQVFEPLEFIAQGDKVVALVYAEATTRHNGRKIVNQTAQVWTFRDGTITRHQAFEDTAAVVAAFRGADGPIGSGVGS